MAPTIEDDKNKRAVHGKARILNHLQSMAPCAALIKDRRNLFAFAFDLSYKLRIVYPLGHFSLKEDLWLLLE